MGDCRIQRVRVSQPKPSLGASREGEMPWALSYCYLSRVNQGNYANATPHASIRVSSSRAVSRVSLVDALALPLRSDVRA